LKYDDQKVVIDYINSLNLTWTAGINSVFNGMTFEEINDFMGIKREESTSIAEEEALRNKMKLKIKRTMIVILVTTPPLIMP